MLALGAAPAIVRAESLMRLWVPPQEISIANWKLNDEYYRGNVGHPADQFVFFIHPTWEESMRELIGFGSATVVMSREVRRHG